MAFLPQFEPLEDRRLFSATVGVFADVVTNPIDLVMHAPVVRPHAVSAGLWNLVGDYDGTYTDVKNSLGPTAFDVVFTRQRHGVLRADISGNGATFTATGTIDADGKVKLVYKQGDHTYRLNGQIGQGGTRLAGVFSIRQSGVLTSWGTFLTHKHKT